MVQLAKDETVNNLMYKLVLYKQLEPIIIAILLLSCHRTVLPHSPSFLYSSSLKYRTWQNIGGIKLW